MNLRLAALVSPARAGTVLLGVLLTGAALSPVFSPRLAQDYSSVPPNPATIFAQLGEAGASLSQVIAAAEARMAGGRVASVSFTGEQYEATVYTASAKHRVLLDASTGKVLSDESIARFPGRAVSGEWTEMPSGVKYYDIVAGTGEKPPSRSTTVEVHYSGWFVDGTKFDSSVDRGGPTQSRLDRVIAGWTEGIGDMRVGGIRKLIIPYDQAYGPAGRAPSIPPKATLIFDIELLRIVR